MGSSASEDDLGDDYHREVDDPWDGDRFAVTGPVEAHGRGLDFGLLLLRLATLPLIARGAHAAVDMPAFTEEVGSNVIGGQAPDFVAWVVMLALVGLPVLLAVGLFTRPAAFLLAALMAAIWVFMVYLRLDYALLTDEGSLTGESALLYLGLTLPLAFTGAGRLSVDSLRTGGRP